MGTSVTTLLTGLEEQLEQEKKMCRRHQLHEVSLAPHFSTNFFKLSCQKLKCYLTPCRITVSGMIHNSPNIRQVP